MFAFKRASTSQLIQLFVFVIWVIPKWDKSAWTSLRMTFYFLQRKARLRTGRCAKCIFWSLGAGRWAFCALRPCSSCRFGTLASSVKANTLANWVLWRGSLSMSRYSRTHLKWWENELTYFMVHGVAQGATAWRRRNNRTKKQQNLSRFAAKNQHAFYLSLSLTACAKKLTS